MPSIRDIAKTANVSIGTVSRVLNSQPHVSESARQKVLKAANLLRDSSTPASRRATSTVALVYQGKSSIGSHFDAALLQGINDELDRTKYDLMLINIDRASMPGETMGQMLLRKGVSGALLRTTTDTRRMCAELGEEGFPAVAIADHIDHVGVSSIFCDTTTPVRNALTHLFDLGHRRIGVVTNSVLDHDHQQRIDAIHRFLAEHDLPWDDRWLIRCSADLIGGRTGLQRLLAIEDRPTAILVLDPLVGLGISLEAPRLGLEIPRDLSVISFDDTDDRLLATPPLSSIVQPTVLLGQRATQLLVDLVDRRGQASLVTLECRFESLDSTSVPAASSAS